MNRMEEAILDIIRKKYKCEYNGGLKVTKLKTGYKVVFYLSNEDIRPLSIAADIDNEESFLKFIEKELVSRQLHRVKYFRGIKIYPEDEGRRTC